MCRTHFIQITQTAAAVVLPAKCTQENNCPRPFMGQDALSVCWVVQGPQTTPPDKYTHILQTPNLQFEMQVFW